MMPKTKEQNELLRQAKRERILQEAILLFSQHGFSETTVAMVSKASEVSFGSVFTYFPTKEDLFQAAVLEPLSKLKSLLLTNVVESGSPFEQLTRMVHTQVRIFSENGIFLHLIQYVLGQPTRFSELFTELNQFLSDFVDYLKPKIIAWQKSGQLSPIDPQLVALSYISYLNGIRLTIVDSPQDDIWELFAQQALYLFRPVQN